MFVIVGFKDVDLSLRISQPNLDSAKRDGSSTSTNFNCGLFGDMETGNAQVNSLLPCRFFDIYHFVEISGIF